MSRRGWNQLAGGLLLIGIGVYFLLHQMGIMDLSLGRLISIGWPLILVWIGLDWLVTNRRSSGALWGAYVPLVLGIYFLGKNLGWIGFSMGDLIKYALPIALIGYGLSVILKPGGSRKDSPASAPEPKLHHDHKSDVPEVPQPPNLESSLDEMFEQTFGPSRKSKSDDSTPPESEENVYGVHGHTAGDYSEKRRYSEHWNQRQQWGEQYEHAGEVIEKNAFIADFHIGKDYFTLKPTNVSLFIGDTVIDLTKAQIPYGETEINISAFIGDIKVFVPHDSEIGVKVSTTSFIGDMSVLGEKQSGFMSSTGLESPFYSEAGKRIKINVSVFIGDVKVNKVG